MGYGAEKASWSSTKKDWCCEIKGIGCETRTLVNPYNCSVDRKFWEAWSPEKKAYCCTHNGLGCDKFDCDLELVHADTVWCPERKAWCCAVYKKGCYSQAHPAVLPDGYIHETPLAQPSGELPATEARLEPESLGAAPNQLPAQDAPAPCLAKAPVVVHVCNAGATEYNGEYIREDTLPGIVRFAKKGDDYGRRHLLEYLTSPEAPSGWYLRRRLADGTEQTEYSRPTALVVPTDGWQVYTGSAAARDIAQPPTVMGAGTRREVLVVSVSGAGDIGSNGDYVEQESHYTAVGVSRFFTRERDGERHYFLEYRDGRKDPQNPNHSHPAGWYLGYEDTRGASFFAYYVPSDTVPLTGWQLHSKTSEEPAPELKDGGACETKPPGSAGASTATLAASPATSPTRTQVLPPPPPGVPPQFAILTTTTTRTTTTSTTTSTEEDYVGCFKDGTDRDLPISKGNGSLQHCAQACFSGGYMFFGRQFAQECWCGNSYGKYGASSACRCNSNNVGSGVNCVYKLAYPASKVENYVGCFKDGSVQRDLPVNKSHGSLEQCAKACFSEGYTFFGRQFTHECWCGNSYGKYGASSACRCDGDNVGGGVNCVYKLAYLALKAPVQLVAGSAVQALPASGKNMAPGILALTVGTLAVACAAGVLGRVRLATGRRLSERSTYATVMATELL